MATRVPKIDGYSSEAILQRIEWLEEDILALKGRPIVSRGSTSKRDLTADDDALDVLQTIIQTFVPQERITSTGTSHSLSAPPAVDSSGNPLLVLELNGTTMFRGGTSNLGWTFTPPNTITTVRSMTAADFMWARFFRKQP